MEATPADPVDVVGVVGAGTMGAGIAQLALEAGHTVFIHDVDAPAIERGRARIRTGLERRASRLDLDPESAESWVDGRLVRLRDSRTLAALAAADPTLVIEAALEDLAAKRAIFGELGTSTPKDAILATNTSALSVWAIARGITHPERVLGLHFFNPAPIMPLVEVVVAPATDSAVAERAASLMAAWGKVTVRSADAPGFIVNRVNRPFTLEALAMLESGRGTVVSIDSAIRASGYPMGPFELMDLVGLDINLAAALGIYERARGAGDPLAERFRPSPIQERLVASGQLGRKTGLGFYGYGPEGRALGPAREFVPADGFEVDLPTDEVVERIMLAIVNEAYRALGEGVATAADIDLAMRLGAGHPAGPFEWVRDNGGEPDLWRRIARLAGLGPRFSRAS